MNIYSEIVESIKTLNKTAFIFNDRELSFSELFTQVNIFAAKLKQNIKETSSVVFQADDNYSFIITLLALLKLNHIAVPLSSELTEVEILDTVTRLSANCYLRVSSNLEYEYKIIKSEDICFKNFTNPAVIRFTSGTTGQGKGVVISHEAILERIKAAYQGLELNEDDVIYFNLPIAFHFVVSILLYLKYGLTTIILDDNSFKKVSCIFRKIKPTISYTAPFNYLSWLAEDDKEFVNSLRLLISTSTVTSLDLEKKFYHKFGKKITPVYGIIEVGLPISRHVSKQMESQLILGNIGKPLPTYQVKIEGDKSEGHLYIKGPGMFSGYAAPFRLLEEILEDGWFKTGDIAKLEDSEIILLGRDKNVVNVAGYKVFPEEVEEVINSVPGVKLSKVYGKEHSLFGNILVADIVLKEDISKISIKEECRIKLSKNKIPQEINFVEKILMTKSGKVIRE